jgi:hypothetical protein
MTKTMARPKRHARKPVSLHFGKYRSKAWKPKEKGGYASLRKTTTDQGRRGISSSTNYVTGSKRRQALLAKEHGKKVAKIIGLVDKKHRRGEAKKAVKKICETTSGKLRRKVNSMPVTRKARGHAVRGKDQYGVCHKKQIPDKEHGGTKTLHRVLPRTLKLKKK